MYMVNSEQSHHILTRITTIFFTNSYQRRQVLWVLVAELSTSKLASLRKTCAFQGYVTDISSYTELPGSEMCLTVFSTGFAGVGVTPPHVGDAIAGSALCDLVSLKQFRVQL